MVENSAAWLRLLVVLEEEEEGHRGSRVARVWSGGGRHTYTSYIDG
jgi:hypothetical protein